MKYQIHYKEGSPLSWRRGDNWFHCMEWSFLFKTIKELSKILDDSWKLIVTGESSLPDFEGHDPNKIIVFQISDEKYGIPEFHKQVKAVFKHYVKSDCESGNVYPIPQGVMTGFVELPYRELRDRSIDLFFSGNYHTNRKSILDRLKTEFGEEFNVVFLENNAVSMVQPTYSHYLMDSKVVLDLDGALGPETFRYFESQAAGCITITSKDKPDNWIYNNNENVIKVDWADIDNVIQEIRAALNYGLNRKYSKISKNAYHEYDSGYLSALSVAKRVARTLGVNTLEENSIKKLEEEVSKKSEEKLETVKKKVYKKKTSKGKK